MIDYSHYIERTPEICSGEAVLKGTRIPVRTILASLEAGDDFSAIQADFPSVTDSALKAVVAFAAASAREDIPLLPLSA
jgi:uncharacterized protein (DUF433 family)